MYILTIFIKTPLRFDVKFKEEADARAARQNLLDQKKAFVDDHKDIHVVTKGDDGAMIDFWASDFTACMLSFAAEGFNLATIPGRQ